MIWFWRYHSVSSGSFLSLKPFEGVQLNSFSYPKSATSDSLTITTSHLVIMSYVTWLTQRGTNGFAWRYTSPPFFKHCPSAGPLFYESIPTNPKQHQFTPGTLQANQSIRNSAVWQPTPSWLWSSPTEVVKSARGSGSPTVIIRKAISILTSRGNIILVSFLRFCFVKLNFFSLLNRGWLAVVDKNWRIDICCLSLLLSWARYLPMPFWNPYLQWGSQVRL